MPQSGGRVGSGIYFASENSKSACYGESEEDNDDIDCNHNDIIVFEKSHFSAMYF